VIGEDILTCNYIFEEMVMTLRMGKQKKGKYMFCQSTITLGTVNVYIGFGLFATATAEL